MNARLVVRIEKAAELFASTLFAGALAFAARAFLPDVVGGGKLGIVVAAAVLGSVVAQGIIRAVPRSNGSFDTPCFDLPAFEDFPSGELLLAGAEAELLLADEDRLEAQQEQAAEPLELDDVLASISPDSRVVRLFDRASMPTPGQLQSRIDNHLVQRRSPTVPDASEALSEALAELRRSLR